jgi:hypothetical protein
MNTFDKYEELLKPNEAKGRFLATSLYIAFFEYFKNLVVDLPESFFIDGFEAGKITINSRYKEQVLSLHDNKVSASLKWLQSIGCLTKEDYKNFQSIRQYRNDLAHKMLSIVFENKHDDFDRNYSNLISLMLKTHKWWILNIEIPTSDLNPELEYDFDGIITGSDMIINLFTSLALGDEEQTKELYEQFKKERANMGK